jgi:hypothetical protein
VHENIRRIATELRINQLLFKFVLGFEGCAHSRILVAPPPSFKGTPVAVDGSLGSSRT